jgi:hypothetical protein
MNEIKVILDSESGQFIVIDTIVKLSTTITKESIKDIVGIENPSLQDAKDFYIDHIDIAIKNKSDSQNESGYFKSIIMKSDFNGN